MKKKHEMAFTVALWALSAAGIAAAAYLFGGHIAIVNRFVKPPEDEKFFGLGLAIIQVFMIVEGFAVVPFVITRLVGAAGFTAKRNRGFGITAIVPCLPLAALYILTGILCCEYLVACAIILFVFAALEVAAFALGIAAIKKLSAKTPPAQP